MKTCDNAVNQNANCRDTMALHLSAFQFRIRCSIAGLAVRKVDFLDKFELFSSFIPNEGSEIFTKAYSSCLVRCRFYLDQFCF